MSNPLSDRINNLATSQISNGGFGKRAKSTRKDIISLSLGNLTSIHLTSLKKLQNRLSMIIIAPILQ
jgi:hypothetical protein